MNRREFTLAAMAAAGHWPLLAAAQAPSNLKMMIPANPGGGWDLTGRALAAAMQSAKVVQSVQFDNKGGAAGTIGLAQFVNGARGDPNALLVGGMVMVGGIILNKSPVDLSMVTPIARLTSEYVVITVPASSPHKTMADLAKAFKADPGKISWGGGSAGGTDHILIGLVAKAIGADPAKINYVPFKGGGEAIAGDRKRDEHGHAALPEEAREFGVILLPFMAACDQCDAFALVGSERGLGRLGRGRDRVVDDGEIADRVFF